MSVTNEREQRRSAFGGDGRPVLVMPAAVHNHHDAGAAAASAFGRRGWQLRRRVREQADRATTKRPKRIVSLRVCSTCWWLLSPVPQPEARRGGAGGTSLRSSVRICRTAHYLQLLLVGGFGRISVNQ